jgi:FKBP-type peptidyl-prolyl cis-trans isomerase FkpA
MLIIRIFIVLIIGYMTSCGSHNNTQAKKVNFDSLREPLINANKLSVKRESDEIDQYAKFKGWDMITTGTGIRYMIYKHGDGAMAKTGQWAKMNYKISLLNGTLCYSSDVKGPKAFMIGEDHVESGLHEAITYLHVGDKAMIILPSHLAFGLSGDDNKIPPRSSVLYDIELLSLR